jgi:hypothetical protein
MKLLWLFATQLRAINAELGYNSQLSFSIFFQSQKNWNHWIISEVPIHKIRCSGWQGEPFHLAALRNSSQLILIFCLQARLSFGSSTSSP